MLSSRRPTPEFPNEVFGSPLACVRAAIYVQYFTRGERGVGQKQNCVDDFFDLTDPADRGQPSEKVMSFRFMHRSIDHSSAMVFTRMPSFAYSMARARVTAFKPPFNMIWTAAPTPAIGWSTRVVDMLTMLPDFCRNICFMASCVT